MDAAAFKLDTREFNETLRNYSNYSRRSFPEIVNTKAFFIARRAVVETIKADTGKIRRNFADRKGQEIIGKIINYRRGKRGEKGLYGEAMAEAQALVKAIRLRSVAFVKSGWIPAIKRLEKFVKSKRGAARSEEGDGIGRPKVIGTPKGNALEAKENSFNCFAIIRNMASSKHAHRDVEPMARKGLQKAIEYESLSMKVYIENEMRKAAGMAKIKLTRGGQITN